MRAEAKETDLTAQICSTDNIRIRRPSRFGIRNRTWNINVLLEERGTLSREHSLLRDVHHWENAWSLDHWSDPRWREVHRDRLSTVNAHSSDDIPERIQFVRVSSEDKCLRMKFEEQRSNLLWVHSEKCLRSGPRFWSDHLHRQWQCDDPYMTKRRSSLEWLCQWSS